MSLNKLLTSQAVDEGPTPSEPENVMVNENEEQASETSVNSDGNSDQLDVSPEEQEETALKDRTQKRINGLIGNNRELEEKVIRLEAQQEAYEKVNQSNQEKTLNDYPIDTLNNFITKHKDDPEMSDQVSDAKEIVIAKRIEEGINSKFESQNKVTSKKEGEQLTNRMVDALTEGNMRDNNSEYFVTASNYLNELGSSEFQHINKDHLLASALAQIDHLKTQSNGPTISDRVKTNRNNNLKANTRQSSGGSSDIKSFLEDNPSLQRSSLGVKGTINQAVRKLLEDA